MIDEYIDVVMECDEDMEACFGEIQQVPMRANYDQTDPDAIDYILGREKLLSKDEIKLESGEAEDSIQQEGAKALGPKTIALGTSIAGCKGYYYSGIDFTNKYIYLSLTQRVPDKIVDHLFGLGEHDVINSKVNVISSPSNLTADANKYCIITTPGAQVSFTNLTLNGYSASLEYKLRVKNIGRVDFYTPQSAGGTLISITGLPTTYEQGKVYDIRITGGTAEYAIVDIDGAYYDASFSPEWQVGDKFSIVNSSHYDEIGTITSIDGNRIGYDTIGFDEINLNDEALEDFDSYTIVVPMRPEAGVINLGEGAFSASDNGKAPGRYSVNLARNGRTVGDYSFDAGRDNVVYYASGAIGAYLKHLAKFGFSSGWSNLTTADYAVTLGGGLINPYECGFIGGWCNDPTIPDLLFGIGYGFDGVRKNALNVDKYGNVWVDKDPTMPMGVATKQYVDEPHSMPRIVFNDDTDGSKTKAAIDELAATMPNNSSKQVVICCYPHFNGAYWHATVCKHTENYMCVDMVCYVARGSRALLSKDNGVWGDFEWQNPPLYPGVEYRTTEKWYGKPVYALQCHCGLLPAVGTTADIQHGISCTQVIRTEGQMMYDGNLYGGDSLPYYRTDYGADIRITSTRFGIKLSVVSWDKDPSQISNVEASATIYYVKE